jgi:hypothetical protein
LRVHFVSEARGVAQSHSWRIRPRAAKAGAFAELVRGGSGDGAE